MPQTMSTSRFLTRFLLSVWGLAAVLGIVYLFLKPDAVSQLSAEVETPGAMVVVELFTSQECSSCPLADAVLTQIEADSRNKGQPVYCLAYPVGSVDHSGGGEPGAAAAITERLATYAKTLGTTPLDAPQMIVNGTEQFWGSDQARAVRAISEGLSRVAPVRLEIKASAIEREILVECQIQDAPEGAILSVAWVEGPSPPTPNSVEKSSQAWKPVDVVSDFQSVPLDATFDGTIRLRRSEKRGGKVIAFVQQPGPGRVQGATSVSLVGE